jgi:hypothetical protein
MVKVKPSEKKEQEAAKKTVIINLQKAKIVKWESFDSSKKFRLGWLQIPITEWENPEDVDKQLPEDTWIKNVKLRVNPEKGFFNIVECEVQEKTEGEESGSNKEGQTDSSPLFFTVMKCPNCGEEMEWIRPEAKEVFDKLIYYILQAEVLLGLRKKIPIRVELNG